MTHPLLSQPIGDALVQLQQDSQLLVAAFDAEDMLRHANAAFCQAYQLAATAPVAWVDLMRRNHGSGQGELVETADIEAWLVSAAARRGKLPFRAFAVDFWDGRWIWMTETLHASGWLLCVGSDITALRSQGGGFAQGLRAADRDPVTSLGGRHSTLQMLQCTLVQTDAWPVSVVLLALDGPALGAEAAAALDFSRHLQACIRREDACGRLDEHDYLLILPNAGPGQARSIVERLLGRIRQSLARSGAPAVAYTCSAGLTQACWGEGADPLLQRAAAALALARSAGGDRLVEQAPPQP